MRRLAAKAKTAFLSLVLFSLGVGLCSAPVYAAGSKKVIEAKNGVVSIQFYVKGAAYYLTNGKQYEFYQEFGTNGEGRGGSGTGFFVGKSGEDPTYIVTNDHVVDDYIKAGEGGQFRTYVGTYNADRGIYLVLIAESCENFVFCQF